MQVQREIRIHGQLQHEHIIALYAAFEDAEHVYLALEYANGAHMRPFAIDPNSYLQHKVQAANSPLPAWSQHINSPISAVQRKT